MYARHQSSSSYDADQQGDREQGIEDQGQGGQSNGGEPNGNGEESGRSPSVSEPQPNGKLDHHQEGIRRRHQLRKKTGQNSRKTEDPHGQIPHASSGSARHSGRGGFPGAPQLVLGLFGRLFPRGYSELSDLLKKCETEGIHAAHPLHRLGKIVEKPMEDRKDRAEVEEARRARWLPPGVRGVVVGRNSQFFEEELSDEELELIGALEYRATKTLTLLLIGVSAQAPKRIVTDSIPPHSTCSSGYLSRSPSPPSTLLEIAIGTIGSSRMARLRRAMCRERGSVFFRSCVS